MNSNFEFVLGGEPLHLSVLPSGRVVCVSKSGSVKLFCDGVAKEFKIQNITTCSEPLFESFESGGKLFFIFLSDECSKLIVYDYDDKTTISSYKSSSKISYFTLSSDKKKVVFGESGAVSLFDIESEKKIDFITLPKGFTPSKISSNTDLSRVALISSGGASLVCSFAQKKVVGSFTDHQGGGCFAGFVDEDNFVSISKEGMVLSLDTELMKTNKYNMRFGAYCKSGVFLNSNATFLGIFRDSSFAVIDVESEKTVQTGFFTGCDEPVAASFCEELLKLSVVDAKNRVFIYDIASSYTQFKSAFSKKDFFDCYKIVFENELLCLTEATSLLEDAFDGVCINSMKLAESGNFEGALKYASLFSGITQKRAEARELVESINSLKAMAEFIKAKKYANAYNLCEKNKFLKVTALYKTLEDGWLSTLDTANSLIIKGRMEEAKALFMPYRGVASKVDIIKKIITERDIINLFLKKVSQKDFKSAFELVNIHPFLKEIREYRSLEDIAQKAIQGAKSMLLQGETQKAYDALTALRAMPMIKKEVEQLERRFDVYAKYSEAKKAGDTVKYKLLEKKYPFLAS